MLRSCDNVLFLRWNNMDSGLLEMERKSHYFVWHQPSPGGRVGYLGKGGGRNKGIRRRQRVPGGEREG